ncbi:MAG: ThiF family adenylyltransferase [Gammaproteobacteria bacterium]
MNDEQLLRYSRQILLPEIDVAGQERLGDASVLIVGIGGLGSAAALYLAASGIGRLVLMDPDRVELSNLQRQIAHASADIGRLKTDSARDRLAALNPEVRIQTRVGALDAANARAALAGVDIAVDASDNFAARFALNAACVAAGIPLVSGAALRFEGQVGVFWPAAPGGACYRCLYDDADEAPETCSMNGVVSPLLGIIGSMQALEVVKIAARAGAPLIGRLLLFDALGMSWRSVRVPRDPRCPVCAPGALQPSQSLR